MKRILTAAFLIVALMTVTTVPSCTTRKGSDPTGPALFLATVLILGLTVGGWLDTDEDESAFPPQKYDMLPRFGEHEFGDSILEGDQINWYRTDMLREGDRFRVWSESDMGLRAVLFDDYGDHFCSTNPPGTDFHVEVEAREWTSFYLMVTGHENGGRGPYRLYWEYSY